ncbi:MAG: dihydrodipicolinate reductase [Chloroflexota bacterium]
MTTNRAGIRTVHVGLGYMGAEVVRLAARRANLEIVGAVDTDPQKIGRDLGEVADAGRPLDVTVVATIEEALAKAQADIAVLTTASHLPQVYDQLRELVGRGLHVVSTCEEMAYPWLRHPERAEELGNLALARGVSVLGTGVNPGFVMDSLPVMLTGVCQEVRAISVTRVLDTAKRRLPLQQKTGAGLTVAEFEAKVQSGAISHIGLAESTALIARALDWALDNIQEMIEPVEADRRLASDFIEVAPGRVAGLHQTARGTAGGTDVICLDLWMVMRAENPRDEVCIDGVPPMHMVIPGGTHGDRATVGMVVNSIPLVVTARPGLLTVLDLPLAASIGS